MEAEEHVGFIKVDRAQVEQVLLNLLLNARDAMPDGGEISVRTSSMHLDERQAASRDDLQHGRYVQIDVADTGVGVAPALLSHIFEPFFTTKDVGQGVGLGLAMVHGTVKTVRWRDHGAQHPRTRNRVHDSAASGDGTLEDAC